MTRFNGKKICGKPLAVGFLEQERPDLQGQCREGYQPCNKQTRPDYTVCMEQKADENEFWRGCPIVDMMIALKKDVPSWPEERFDKPNTSDSPTGVRWVSYDYDDELIIRFTKEGDKLPLSTFEVSSGDACMDSHSIVSRYIYPLELVTATSCPLEQTTGREVDPRYSALNQERVNLDFGEWDVMKENGVD